MKIEYLLDNGAFAPEKAHFQDAGFDLRTPYSAVLLTNDYIVVDTGVHMFIPEGYCGLLVSKSGLNVKNGITGTGLIDAGYTGSIRVRLERSMEEGRPYSFERGDKLIQIIILPVPEVDLVQVDTVPDSDRGDNGFGSTGR